MPVVWRGGREADGPRDGEAPARVMGARLAAAAAAARTTHFIVALALDTAARWGGHVLECFGRFMCHMLLSTSMATALQQVGGVQKDHRS